MSKWGIIISLISVKLVLTSVIVLWVLRKENKIYEFNYDAILHLDHCKIPEVQAINKNILTFWNRIQSVKNCSDSQIFSTLQDDEITTFDSPAKYSIASKCTTLTNTNGTVVKNKEFMLVQCPTKDDQKVHFDFHATVPISLDIADKAIFWESNYKKSDRPISIVMIVLESASRNHAMRSIPMTIKYLKQQTNLFDFKGHHVHQEVQGDLSALINGAEGNRSQNSSETEMNIWSIYKDLNYITMYSDDSATLPKKYNNSKIDYNLRGFLQASQEANNIHRLSDQSQCFGNETMTEYVLNYMKRFQHKFEVIPTFSVNFFSASYNNRLESLTSFDQPLLQFFQSLFKSKSIREKTLFILTSTHGYLDHPYFKTHDGLIDRRLPLLLIRIPEQLNHKNPSVLKHATTNQNRITSHGDTYQTLLWVAKLAEETLRSKNLTQKLNWNSTTLRKLVRTNLISKSFPSSKTCLDAGIESHFCACNLPNPPNISIYTDLNEDYKIPMKVNLPEPPTNLA